MNQNKELTKDFLNNLGIYELRELARKMGVSSPTTKIRSELCELILKIQKGEISPNSKNIKRGRPPKSISKLINIADPEQTFNFNNVSKKRDVFNQNNCNSNFFSNEILVKGFLICINGELCFYNNQLCIDKLTLIKISKEVVEQFELRKGDKIVAMCDNSNIDNYVLTKIISINNIPIDKLPYKRECVNTEVAIKTSSKVEIFNEKFVKGTRNILNFDNEDEVIEKISKSSSDFVNIVIGGEILSENFYLLENMPNVYNFVSKYGEDLNIIYNNIVNGYNFAETLLKDGKKIVIYLLNPCAMLKSLNLYFALKNDYLSCNPESIQMIKKILFSARCVSEDVFINVICLKVGECDNDFLKSQIKF